MIVPRQSHSLSSWLPLAVGIALAIAGLEIARHKLIVRLDAAALGANTQFVYASERGEPVLCQDASDGHLCLDAYNKAGRPPAVLWLGNSQMAAINRLKPTDQTASALLNNAVRKRGAYVVTYAQPNANLMEHALALAVLSPLYETKAVILPVFLDDIREQGIREGMADLVKEPGQRESLEGTRVWPHIGPGLAAGAAAAGGEAASADAATLQKRFEAALNARLSAVWPLWQAREQLRGILGLTIHHARNKVLGINAQSKRKVDTNVYREKLAVLEDMLELALERKLEVLLYIPPYRIDIPGPYVEADYVRLKRDLAALAAKHGARFANLEAIVPGPEWGTVVDTLYGIEDYDFMHFTGEGHRRYAQSIDAELKQMGF